MRKCIRLQLQYFADPFWIFIEDYYVAFVDADINGRLIDERACNEYREINFLKEKNQF